MCGLCRLDQSFADFGDQRLPGNLALAVDVDFAAHGTHDSGAGLDLVAADDDRDERTAAIGRHASRITAELRNAGMRTDRAFENRSMKSQMKAADRSGAQVTVIIGSNEVEAGTAVVRPMRGEIDVNRQREVPRETLISEVGKALIQAAQAAHTKEAPST